MNVAILIVVSAQFAPTPAAKLASEIERLSDKQKKVVRTLVKRGIRVRVKDGKVRGLWFPDDDLSTPEIIPRGVKPTPRIRHYLKLITALPELDWLAMPESTLDGDLVHLGNLKQLTHLSLSGCEKFTGSGLVHLRHSRNLTTLNVEYTRINDAAMKHIAGFPKLEDLNLFNSLVTDAGLVHLKGLLQLRKLRVGETSIIGLGFRHLRNLPHLEDLDLSYTFVNDAGFEQLNGLKNLRKLNVYYAALSDFGFAHLPNHPNLTELSFGRMPISDRGMAYVASLKNLEVLRIGGNFTKVTGNCLKHLKSLPKLRTLVIGAKCFTDDCVPDLVELKSLKKLEIGYGTEMTVPGFLKLEKALPRGVLQSSDLKTYRSELELRRRNQSQ